MSGSIVNLLRSQSALTPRARCCSGDAPAALGLPLPDPLDERLAAEVVAGLALALELALDDRLRGDARVIDARLPEVQKPAMRW
jgi:hypothetical protein